MAAKEILPFPDFSYRKNADGTFDSICLFCFQTVASAPSVAELAGSEFLHSLKCKGKKGPVPDRSLK
jgi:hypothetical protein